LGQYSCRLPFVVRHGALHAPGEAIEVVQQWRTYAAGKWVLGGAANGGNGSEVDNSAATIVVDAALMTYTDVGKVVTHYRPCRT
jgi:hypothetical protein